MKPEPDAIALPAMALPREKAHVRRVGPSPLVRAMAALLPVALAVALPFLLSSYNLFLATQVAIFAIATLGLDIVFGRTGQLSLCHAAFFGLGAYGAALLANEAWSPALQFLAVIAGSAIAGAIVAVPTLRLSGLRLSLVTLLFGELFIWTINHTGSLTGGSQGIGVSPLEIGAFSSLEPLHAYWLAVGAAALATLFTIQIARAQIGRRMLAVRDSELAATSMGIHIVATKIAAFILSAVLAGIAGWLYAYVVGFISPLTFNLFGSVNFLVAVILGGAGRTLGAWLGAAYIVLVPEVFSALGYTNLFPLLGGAVLMIVTLLLPGGLVSGIERIGAALARRRRP